MGQAGDIQYISTVSTAVYSLSVCNVRCVVMFWEVLIQNDHNHPNSVSYLLFLLLHYHCKPAHVVVVVSFQNYNFDHGSISNVKWFWTVLLYP